MPFEFNSVNEIGDTAIKLNKVLTLKEGDIEVVEVEVKPEVEAVKVEVKPNPTLKSAFDKTQKEVIPVRDVISVSDSDRIKRLMKDRLESDIPMNDPYWRIKNNIVRGSK